MYTPIKNYMLLIRCKKCNKSFLSEYLLNRHKNKQVPCGTKLSCKKCNKILLLEKKTRNKFRN